MSFKALHVQSKVPHGGSRKSEGEQAMPVWFKDSVQLEVCRVTVVQIATNLNRENFKLKRKLIFFFEF